MIPTFSAGNFHLFCDKLIKKDKDLRGIIKEHGYPPMWIRPNTFQSLILSILEQQVSLASAYAAFKKLKERIGYVTPQKILSLSDKELRNCYFSRQKIVYARELANTIVSGKINLRKLALLSDDEIRIQMIEIKGIGHWTIDVYLMHALQRTDLFPLGDIALVNSLKEVKQLPKDISKEEMLAIAEPWRPYRTIASMILWHDYIKKRGIKLQG
ncbi:MAG TPA: DNA-3-methyladenine glycosylase 2 family protein [Chitinophagaceae bacterium]|nr:DNA-3-methyladenine glycosylase 2 family protein [Chitinophagales bacterium]HPG11240.1 DNA-3-methyladenine glycosylase 2 family protein [Chitinophagaceae bacterium]